MSKNTSQNKTQIGKSLIEFANRVSKQFIQFNNTFSLKFS